MWPLGKSYPRLMLSHQSWFMQWSNIQLWGRNIVSYSLSQRQPFSKNVPGPYTSMEVWGKSLSLHTGLEHPWSLTEATWLLSQAVGSKGSSWCSFTTQQLLQGVVCWGRVQPGEVEQKWGAVVQWDGARRGKKRGRPTSLCGLSELLLLISLSFFALGQGQRLQLCLA